jgi:hypothetical protein
MNVYNFLLDDFLCAVCQERFLFRPICEQGCVARSFFFFPRKNRPNTLASLSTQNVFLSLSIKRGQGEAQVTQPLCFHRLVKNM